MHTESSSKSHLKMYGLDEDESRFYTRLANLTSQTPALWRFEGFLGEISQVGGELDEPPPLAPRQPHIVHDKLVWPLPSGACAAASITSRVKYRIRDSSSHCRCAAGALLVSCRAL